MEMIKKIVSYFKRKPVEYVSVTLNSNELTDEQLDFIKTYRKILSDNRINLNKIRFIFDKSFTYDVDNNVINPPYKTLQPKKKNKNSVTIEINKPENVMTIFLGENRTFNNMDLLKQETKKSKNGIVVLACDEDLEDVIWLTNLDDAIDYYWAKQNIENYEFNT